MRHCCLVLLALLACSPPPPPEQTPAVTTKNVVSPSTSPTAAAAPAPVHVRLLAFNDFHGNLKPPNGKVPKVSGEVGGAAYFAAHLKKLGAGKPDTIIAAAGDLVGASPLTSSLFHDEPTVDVMNAIGLAATAIGNHELDHGIDELLRLKNGGCHPKDGCKYQPSYAGAKYAMLGANVTRTASKELPLPAWILREVNGIPIAFVGMPLEDTPHSVTPEGVAGLSFANEVATANALVPEIRAKGAETIILLVHEGGEVSNPGLDECNDFKGSILPIAEKLDPAFDVIVSGHTHALYNCMVGKRPVTSASSFGRVITSIDLSIDPKTKDVIKTEAHNHAVTHDLPPDPAVQAIVDKAIAAAAPIENRRIGRITETLAGHGRDGKDSPLGSIIADAHLAATKKAGAQLAIVNASGVRTDILFAKSGDEPEDGIVTYGEAYAAQPFSNTLVTLTITGKDLAAVLERELRDGYGLLVSEGFTVRYSPSKKSVLEMKLGDKAVMPTTTVRLTTNNFLAARDPSLKEGKNPAKGPVDLDALEAYFAAHPKVSPPKAARIKRE